MDSSNLDQLTMGSMYRYASQSSLDESSQRHIQKSSSNNTRPQNVFKSMNHFWKMIGEIHNQQKSYKFCDVTLSVGEFEISAHKMILAASSPYFLAMFSSFEESKLNRITLQEIDFKALELLVDYIYTSEILIDEDNVQILLPAANLLQMIEVRDECCSFLKSQLDPSNCIGIRNFADIHSCNQLYNHSDLYIRRYIKDVIKNEEFLNLSSKEVIKLISSDNLSISSEELIFECVIDWINYEKESRINCMAELMEFVRFPLLSKEYLMKRVDQSEMLQSDLKCKDYLLEAYRYHLYKDEEYINVQSSRTKPRVPTWAPKILLVIGGQSPKAIKNVEYYEFKEVKWHELDDMPSRRCRSGVAVLDDYVYLIGGFNGSMRVRCVERYDPSTNTWNSCENMDSRRSTLGVAVHNGLIYAIGGFDGTSGLNTAEVYDPRLNTWRYISNMNVKRSSVGVGVLNGEIYAVGGYDGTTRNCLHSVESYDPKTDVWFYVGDMKLKRSGAGIGVLNGLMYAIGGHDGPTIRKSVEAYDPVLSEWKYVADMNICRRNAGVVTLNDLLYVVGGDDGTSNLSSVEFYCPETNKWTLLPSQMTIGRSYAGVAIVDKPI